MLEAALLPGAFQPPKKRRPRVNLAGDNDGITVRVPLRAVGAAAAPTETNRVPRRAMKLVMGQAAISTRRKRTRSIKSRQHHSGGRPLAVGGLAVGIIRLTTAGASRADRIRRPAARGAGTRLPVTEHADGRHDGSPSLFQPIS